MKTNVLSAMCGLSEANLDNVNTVFAKHPEVTKVVLYGSRAKGNYRLGSDVDLTLYGHNLTNEKLGEIASQIDDLYLPYTFDISIFNQIDSPELIDHIHRVGTVLYES